jgi:hypothetical protein
MSEQRRRRQFTPEFKMEAVRLVSEGGKGCVKLSVGRSGQVARGGEEGQAHQPTRVRESRMRRFRCPILLSASWLRSPVRGTCSAHVAAPSPPPSTGLHSRSGSRCGKPQPSCARSPSWSALPCFAAPIPRGCCPKLTRRYRYNLILVPNASFKVGALLGPNSVASLRSLSAYEIWQPQVTNMPFNIGPHGRPTGDRAYPPALFFGLTIRLHPRRSPLRSAWRSPPGEIATAWSGTCTSH